MYLFEKNFNKIKDIFKNLEKKTLKIMKIGLNFSLLTAVFSAIILITYLFFVHNFILYQVGLLVFQLSLYFAVDFIVSGITVDSIKKQII